MMLTSLVLVGTLLSCWAPSVAPLEERSPPPREATERPQPPPRADADIVVDGVAFSVEEGAPPQADPAPEGPQADPQAPAEASSPTEPPLDYSPVWTSVELPPAPFTAWTAAAPLTLVAPGGAPVAVLRRMGVRVEVLQVLPTRVLVRCDGCEVDPGAEVPEGWVGLRVLRAADDHGDPHDALSALLRQRADWAGGKGIPEGMDAASLCALVDHGFRLLDGEAWLDHGGITAGFAWAEGAWRVRSMAGQPTQQRWSCRTTRPSQRGQSPLPR